jgi:DNA repair exonuclease SbcCD ATPase subunit
MMDIVERLRIFGGEPDTGSAYNEAADEITKLRAELEAVHTQWYAVMDERNAARAELAEANQTIEEQINVRHAWEMHSALQDKELAEAKKDAARYRAYRRRAGDGKCFDKLTDDLVQQDEAIYEYKTREQQP